MTSAIAGQLTLYDALGSPPPEPVQQDVPTASGPISHESGLQADSHGDGGDGAPPAVPAMEVEVIRSGRRRKTAQAVLHGARLEVRIPASCSKKQERVFVEHFVEKFERSRRAALVDLNDRACELADRYGLPRPSSIRWVSNQKSQWGSCTPSEGTIRLSDRMAGFPRWVIDYVIVHELAHLVEADHGPAFWKLVEAYPKTERARGYLLAKDGV